MSDLPRGWVEARLDAVAAVNPPPVRDLGDDDVVSFVPMASVEAETGRLDPSERRPVSEVRRKSYRSFAEGDVLFAKVTPCMENGKIALAAGLANGLGFGSSEFHVVRPFNGISAKFIMHFLLQKRFRDDARRDMSGTAGLLRVSSRFLESSTIPIPPSAEQERIVAAIEEQFSRLDAGVAALERVRQNLKRMRAAVLRDSWDMAAAVAGGLSRVADLLDCPLANGRSVPDGAADGFPVLRLTCVRDGVIDDTQSKVGAWTAEQANHYLVRAGDFLVIRGNGSKHLVGRGGLVKRDAAVAYPDTLIRIRPDPNRITARFLGLLWDSSSVRRQLEDAARTTAGIYKINQVSLGLVELPAPALETQENILDLAASQLSQTDLLNAEIANALGRNSHLRSAILMAAFSGKLIPQDPTDEPASVLLERIAAERASSNGHKTTHVRKSRTTRPKVPHE